VTEPSRAAARARTALRQAATPTQRAPASLPAAADELLAEADQMEELLRVQLGALPALRLENQRLSDELEAALRRIAELEPDSIELARLRESHAALQKTHEALRTRFRSLLDTTRGLVEAAESIPEHPSTADTPAAGGSPQLPGRDEEHA
jgi:hypothetical protein